MNTTSALAASFQDPVDFEPLCASVVEIISPAEIREEAGRFTSPDALAGSHDCLACLRALSREIFRDETGQVWGLSHGYAKDFDRERHPYFLHPITGPENGLEGAFELPGDFPRYYRLSGDSFILSTTEGFRYLKITSDGPVELGTVPRSIEGGAVSLGSDICLVGDNTPAVILDESRTFVTGEFTGGEFRITNRISFDSFYTAIGTEEGAPLCFRGSGYNEEYGVASVITRERERGERNPDRTNIMLVRDGEMKLLGRFEGQHSITVSDDASLVALDLGGSLNLYRVENEELVLLLTEPKGDASIAFNGDGSRMAAVFNQGSGPVTLKSWEISPEAVSPGAEILFDAFSYPGDVTFSSGDSIVFSEDPMSSNLARADGTYWHSVDLRATRLALGEEPDGDLSRLAIGEEATTRDLVRAVPGIEVLHIFDSPPRRMVQSKDGGIVAVACEDGSVTVLDFDEEGASVRGEVKAPDSGAKNRIFTELDLSDDGHRLLIRDAARGVSVYALPDAGEPRLEWRYGEGQVGTLLTAPGEDRGLVAMSRALSMEGESPAGDVSFAGFLSDPRFVVVLRNIEFERGRVELHRIDRGGVKPVKARTINADAYVNFGKLSPDREVLVTSENGALCHGFRLKSGDADSSSLFRRRPAIDLLWRQELAAVHLLEFSPEGTRMYLGCPGSIAARECDSQTFEPCGPFVNRHVGDSPKAIAARPGADEIVVSFPMTSRRADRPAIHGLAVLSAETLNRVDGVISFVSMANEITALQFSPGDSSLLLTARSGELARVSPDSRT